MNFNPGDKISEPNKTRQYYRTDSIFIINKSREQAREFGKVEQLLYTPIKAYFTAVLQGGVTGVRSGQHLNFTNAERTSVDCRKSLKCIGNGWIILDGCFGWAAACRVLFIWWYLYWIFVCADGVPLYLQDMCCVYSIGGEIERRRDHHSLHTYVHRLLRNHWCV